MDTRQSIEILRKTVTDRQAAYLLYRTGHTLSSSGDYEAARERFYISMNLWCRCGDKVGAAACLHGLAQIDMDQGNCSMAQFLLLACRELLERADCTEGVHTVDVSLATLACFQGEVAVARRMAVERLDHWRTRKQLRWVAAALQCLCLAASCAGESREAVAHGEESFSLYRKLGSGRGLTAVLMHLARAALQLGKFAPAGELYRKALRSAMESGHRLRAIEALEGSVYAAIHDPAAASAGAQRLGAAAAMREKLNCPLMPMDERRHRHTVQILEESLGKPAFCEDWQHGEHMTWEEVTGAALLVPQVIA
jgi:tetratricopeptide (TPR) repeat protein